MNGTRATMRLNKTAFEQFYNSQKRIAGSERALARKSGVSHTTIQRLAAGRHGMTVNVITAQKIEAGFGCPPGIIFMPELLPAASNTPISA